MESAPILKFSKWYQWDKRNEFIDKKYSGVYAIAISEMEIDNHSFDWNDVSYIGMSHSSKGLEDRWSFLDNAIKGNSNGHHSGGKRIFNSLGPYDRWDKKMFVAAFAIRCDSNKNRRTPEDLRKLGHVAYLEFEALA